MRGSGNEIANRRSAKRAGESRPSRSPEESSLPILIRQYSHTLYPPEFHSRQGSNIQETDKEWSHLWDSKRTKENLFVYLLQFSSLGLFSYDLKDDNVARDSHEKLPNDPSWEVNSSVHADPSGREVANSSRIQTSRDGREGALPPPPTKQQPSAPSSATSKF